MLCKVMLYGKESKMTEQREIGGEGARERERDRENWPQDHALVRCIGMAS